MIIFKIFIVTIGWCYSTLEILTSCQRNFFFRTPLICQFSTNLIYDGPCYLTENLIQDSKSCRNRHKMTDDSFDFMDPCTWPINSIGKRFGLNAKSLRKAPVRLKPQPAKTIVRIENWSIMNVAGIIRATNSTVIDFKILNQRDLDDSLEHRNNRFWSSLCPRLESPETS